MVCQNLVTVVAAYVIAFTSGWKMTLVITAAVPLLGAGAWINTKFLLGFSSKVCMPVRCQLVCTSTALRTAFTKHQVLCWPQS